MKNDDQEMNADRLKLLIQRELDGEILPEEEAELQQALSENEDLREIYQEDRRLSALMSRDRDQIVMPAGLADAMADRILQGSAVETAETIDFFRYLKPVAMAACLLLMVGVGFFVGRDSVTAKEIDSMAGLRKKKQIILEEYPDLNRTEVDALFDACFRRLEEIEENRRQESNKAFVDLEAGAEKLIRKAKVKVVESK